MKARSFTKAAIVLTVLLSLIPASGQALFLVEIERGIQSAAK